MAFGEDISAEIFKNLNEYEVKRIGTAMSRIGRIDEEIIEEVLIDFHGLLQKDQQFFYGGQEFTKNVLGSAFKGENADEIIDSLALDASNLDSLELIDPKTLGIFLRNEHPQTIALILGHLDPRKCGEVIKVLPDSMHTEIMVRMANLEAVAPDIIDEIEDVLREEVQAMGSIGNTNLGGVEPIANMLNLMDKATEERILDHLEERDPDLSAINTVFTTIRTAYQLHEKTASPMREPLIVKIRIRISPEIKVFIGEPIIQ